MKVFRGIVSPKRLHGDIVLSDVEAVRNPPWHVFEDLLLRERMGQDERIVERVEEADLNQSGVGWLLWSSARGRNNMWQARRNACCCRALRL